MNIGSNRTFRKMKWQTRVIPFPMPEFSTIVQIFIFPASPHAGRRRSNRGRGCYGGSDRRRVPATRQRFSDRRSRRFAKTTNVLKLRARRRSGGRVRASFRRREARLSAPHSAQRRVRGRGPKGAAPPLARTAPCRRAAPSRNPWCTRA